MPQKRGFTLIEVLIVLIIIGILATLAVPQFNVVIERTRKAEALMNLSAIYSAANVYYVEKGAWPPAGTSLDTLGITIGGNRYFTYSIGTFNTKTCALAQRSATGDTLALSGQTIGRAITDGTIRASTDKWGITTTGWE